MQSHLQALFLHDRLIADALTEEQRYELAADIERRERFGLTGESQAAIAGAFEHALAQLLPVARELSVAVLEEKLAGGGLVTLTQDFNIRRDSEERGSFRTLLDSDRETRVNGRFSTSRLIGSTGPPGSTGMRVSA